MFRIQRWVIAGAMLLLFIASALPVSAAAATRPQPAPLAGTTITVTSTGDDLSANGNCTLREAIQAANLDRGVDRCPAGSGTDVIRLGERTYRMTRAGRVENSNVTGDFDIRSSMVIAGAGIGKTILELNGLDRAFDVRLTEVSVRIQDLTIQNGMTGDGTVPDHGGAVANRGTMTIRRVHFANNHVTGMVYESGGAVWNKYKLYVTGSLFTLNSSESFGGALGNTASVTVDSTTFDGNTGTVGGAVYNSSTGIMALNTSSKFYRNQCGIGSGAAVYNDGVLAAKYNRYEANGPCDGAVVQSTGRTTIRYTSFKNNETQYGVVSGFLGNLTVTHSYLYGNRVLNPDSGQIYARGAAVVIDRSTIQSGDGVGLYADSGMVRVANSTFANVRSSNCAGAVCGLGSASLSLESVTISGTRTRIDGAALTGMGGRLTVHNTIVTNTRSMDGTVYAPDCSGRVDVFQSRGYNLITRADGCTFAQTTGDKFGSMSTPLAAGLAPLAMNGGRTPTYALTPTSQAVDAADPALTVKSDQRGYIRPAGPRADIGSFELGAVAP